MIYRIGRPFWKFLARHNIVDLEYRVYVHYDPEVNRYWATSPDIHGLVCETDSIQEMAEVVDDCARILVEDELDREDISRPVCRITYVPA